MLEIIVFHRQKGDFVHHFLFAHTPVILHVRIVLLHLRHVHVYRVRHCSRLGALLRLSMLDEQWRRCVNDFLRSKQDKSGSEHTVVNYHSVLSRFFAQVPDPSRATRQDVEDFLHMSFDHATQAPSPSTRNTRLAILSSFYAYASTYNVAGIPLMRSASPTLGIQSSVRTSSYRAFTPAELQKFFSVIPTDTIRGLRDRALFACLFWCARRRSEIVNLLYGDLFSGIVTDADGTRRTAYLYRFRNKGHKTGYDIAELPEPAKAAIDRYLVASGRIASIAEDDPIFIGIAPPSGGLPIDPYRPLSGHSAWNALRKYAKAANLDYRRLSVHALRHSAARERYLINPDVREIQQLLRHSNLATTDRYLHTMVPTGDQTAKLLEERFRDFEW